MAAWLARELAGRGLRVAIASRGYGRTRGEAVTVVSDGQRMLASLDECGDEAMLLASHAPGVPVLVASRRDLAGLRAVSAFGAQLLILDDGFQHHRLARDFELLVFDGATGVGNGCVLPRGPLRERLSLLARADAIAVVDGGLAPEHEATLAEWAPEAMRLQARRRPLSVRPLRGGPRFSPRTLAGMRVGLLAGIGSPEGFRRTLESLGASVVAERRFPDHHRYRRRDLAQLSAQARVWVTTEKDAIKLRPEWARGADVRVLRVALDVQDPDASGALLDACLATARVGQGVDGHPQPLAAQVA
jgi:tetraacyldisaccharide 4'-kinase